MGGHSVRTIGNPQVGDLDADFSGILGFLFELVFEAFEGVVRDIVVDAIKGFLQDNVDRVLTDLLGNVDIWGRVSACPITGDGDVELSVQAVWNRLKVKPELGLNRLFRDHPYLLMLEKVFPCYRVPMSCRTEWDGGRGRPSVC